MSIIHVTVCIKGAFKESRGFVNTEIRDAVDEISYAHPGKIGGGGRYIDAIIPDDKFEEFCNAMGDDYKISRKTEPAHP